MLLLFLACLVLVLDVLMAVTANVAAETRDDITPGGGASQATYAR